MRSSRKDIAAQPWIRAALKLRHGFRPHPSFEFGDKVRIWREELQQYSGPYTFHGYGNEKPAWIMTDKMQPFRTAQSDWSLLLNLRDPTTFLREETGLKCSALMTKSTIPVKSLRKLRKETWLLHTTTEIANKQFLVRSNQSCVHHVRSFSTLLRRNFMKWRCSFVHHSGSPRQRRSQVRTDYGRRNWKADQASNLQICSRVCS